MSYLFGDSTRSRLTSNFIELLRESMELSVHVLLADERMQRCRQRMSDAQHAADAEVSRLQTLEKTITRGVEQTPKGDPDSPTSRCAEAVLKGVAESVQAAQARIRVTLEEEIAKLEAAEGKERDGCLTALEALLLRHDPPDTAPSLRLEQLGGVSYAAHLHCATGYGLTWTLELEIPQAHLFGHIVRVDKFIPHLEVQAPELGGWIRKEMKLRPQRLDRYYLTKMVHGPAATTLALCANADGEGTTFEVTVKAQAPCVTFARVGEQSDVAGEPFEISEEDAGKLVALVDKLTTAAGELQRGRKRLLQFFVDGDAFRDHYQPSALVDRLIGAIAPIAREISEHSLSPTELVLKRLLADDRREEIFVSKAALLEKLAPLSPAQRDRFLPLGLSAPPRPPPSSRDFARPEGPSPERVSSPPPERVSSPPPERVSVTELPRPSAEPMRLSTVDIVSVLHDPPAHVEPPAAEPEAPRVPTLLDGFEVARVNEAPDERLSGRVTALPSERVDDG